MEVPVLVALSILQSYKESIREHFNAFAHKPVLASLAASKSPEEALRLGVLLGRQEGYEEGLVEGTRLGLTVGLDAVDAMMAQPVVLSPGGSA